MARVSKGAGSESDDLGTVSSSASKQNRKEPDE